MPLLLAIQLRKTEIFITHNKNQLISTTSACGRLLCYANAHGSLGVSFSQPLPSGTEALAWQYIICCANSATLRLSKIFVNNIQ
jgi:hypothetical protein